MTHQIIVLDTETTAVENPEVIELAWRAFDIANPGLPPAAGACHRFKPQKDSQWGALSVHHILPSELIGMPPAATAPKTVPAAEYWVGHNVDFDWKALGQPKVKRICTLAMCRSLWPDLDSHNQTAMMYYLFGANPETRMQLRHAHSAEDDIGFTAAILMQIINLKGLKAAEDLYAFSEFARIPTKFTFGKFRGQPISAADRGYANWYNRQPDPDPYLIEAFRRARLL